MRLKLFLFFVYVSFAAKGGEYDTDYSQIKVIHLIAFLRHCNYQNMYSNKDNNGKTLIN